MRLQPDSFLTIQSQIEGLREKAFQEGYDSGWQNGFNEGLEQGLVDGSY
jgi:flagellar biosynthesis/type III secretory pathway protein FliH